MLAPVLPFDKTESPPGLDTEVLLDLADRAHALGRNFEEFASHPLAVDSKLRRSLINFARDLLDRVEVSL